MIQVGKFQRDRNFDELKAYVAKMLGSSDKPAADEEAKEDSQSSVIALTSDNFATEIEKSVAFVKFFAPW